MINGKKVFYQPVKTYIRTYDSIRKIPIGQGDDYTRLSARLCLF